jgi:hypothetical protein
MASWYLRSASGDYLRLSYNGATAKMEASLIPSKRESVFCYAAEWGTKAAAERQAAKYEEQFPGLVAVR